MTKLESVFSLYRAIFFIRAHIYFCLLRCELHTHAWFTRLGLFSGTVPNVRMNYFRANAPELNTDTPSPLTSKLFLLHSVDTVPLNSPILDLEEVTSAQAGQLAVKPSEHAHTIRIY
jgi:hypothetical protein